jgi:DNA-binding response OmpR family regulator
MLRVLVCAAADLGPQLRETFIGRQGIETYQAERLPDVKLLASTLGPQLILVDAELPSVKAFLEALRKEPATRQRSVAVVDRSASARLQKELLEAGANVALRWPPDKTFDARLSRLMTVPARLQARLPVELTIDTQPESSGTIQNLSVGGMLLQTRKKLSIGDEMGFRLPLPDGEIVEGRARVAREAPPAGYGLEFVSLVDEGRAAISQYLRSARLD